MAEGWRNLGNVCRQQGQYEQASQHYEDCVLVCLEHGLDKHEAFYASGLLALHCNNYTLASLRFTHLLGLAKSPDKTGNAGTLLVGLAAVAAGTNHPERAAKLCGAAQALFETTGDRTPPLDRAEFDRHIRIAREQLGEAAFEALAAEGRAMTLGQAIEMALQGMN
jgi:hypothetical protein